MNNNPTQEEIFAKAKHIKLLVLDVDGVLTNGQLFFSNTADELKAFSTLDGHGIKLLQNAGIQVALITGRTSELVARRAENLGIKILVQGREDKLVALDDILNKLNLQHSSVAYIGDDWPDLACIRKAALGVTVPNAHQEIKKHAFCMTTSSGGFGAVREVCDWILKAQNLYDQALQDYL